MEDQSIVPFMRARMPSVMNVVGHETTEGHEGGERWFPKRVGKSFVAAVEPEKMEDEREDAVVLGSTNRQQWLRAAGEKIDEGQGVVLVSDDASICEVRSGC